MAPVSQEQKAEAVVTTGSQKNRQLWTGKSTAQLDESMIFAEARRWQNLNLEPKKCLVSTAQAGDGGVMMWECFHGTLWAH